MTRIGLLSDTHAYWDEKYLTYFECCDEIWHVGDIGSMEVADKLEAFRPLRAVYGISTGRISGAVFAGQPLCCGWCGSADEAYRRLPGQV